MPDIDTNISDLWWLKKDWKETDTTAYFKMGADLMQKKRDNAMKMVEFSTSQKEADVRMHNQLLDQQLKQFKLDDASELKKAQVALQTGEDYEPSFKTHTAALSWKSLKGMSEEGQAQQKLYDDYLDVIGYTPTAATSLGRYKRFSPEWGEALQNWKKYVDTDRSNQKALAAQSAEATRFESKSKLEQMKEVHQEMIAEMRNDTTLEGVRLRSQLASQNAPKMMDHANLARYKAEMKAIVDGLGKPDAKQKQLDALDEKYGVSGKFTTPTPSTGVRLRRKSDGEEFFYKGDAADVPTDQYELVK